jgi:hypothetical protein
MALTKIKSHSVALNSLTVANIADNAIDATKIASNSILTRHIDDNQINIDQLNVADGSSGQVLSTNGSGVLAFVANTIATNLTVYGRSANVSVPVTAAALTVVARSGNVSVGVS